MTHIARLSLLVSAALLSIHPVATQAATISTSWYAGAGMGNIRMAGDYQRAMRTQVFQSGVEAESSTWLLDFSGYAATDNRFKGLTLIGAVGNTLLKVGTGFAGLQSSYPTRPGRVAGFFDADTSEDTDVSLTSIPLFVRLHLIHARSVSITLDGYTSLYTSGSINIPVHTLIPGVTGKLAAESKKTGRTYGGEITLMYRFSRQMGLRLSYQRRVGDMATRQARILGDFFGVTTPVALPTVSMQNNIVLLSVVYHSQ